MALTTAQRQERFRVWRQAEALGHVEHYLAERTKALKQVAAIDRGMRVSSQIGDEPMRDITDEFRQCQSDLAAKYLDYAKLWVAEEVVNDMIAEKGLKGQ